MHNKQHVQAHKSTSCVTTSSNMPSDYYPWVDVFRVLCAAFVVLIHCSQIKEGHPFVHMIVTCFTSQAVPFFFIVSGFFFAQKLRASTNKISYTIHYTKKTLLLYLVWMILEFPGMLSTYLSLYPKASPLYLILLLFRRVFFAGQGVYWYLLILAESILIAGLCIRYEKENLLYVLSSIGLLLCFAYDFNLSFGPFTYLHTLFYTIFSWSNNFLMKGLPFVTIGVYLSQRRGNCPSSKLMLAYLLISAISIAYFSFCYFHNLSNIQYLCLYPLQATLLFQIAIQSKRSIHPYICHFCREISSVVYFLHTVALYYIVNPLWSVYASIPLKFSFAVLFSLCVYVIAKATRFKPLCWLLSIKP